MALDEGLLRDARQTRERMLDLQHQAELTRVDHDHLVRRLHAGGATMREIADALGLSHQRIHQIVDGGRNGKEPAKTTLLGRLGRRSESGARRLRQAGCACSLCGRGGFEVEQLVAGPGVFICDRCIEVAAELLEGGDRDSELIAVAPGSDSSCSFCRKGSKRTGPLIVGRAAAICGSCTGLGKDIEARGRERA